MTEQIEHQKEGPRRQNSEQERGRQAWANIKEIKNQHNVNLEKEYRSSARGLNAMIQINGLGQTLGFLKAKGKEDAKKPHYLLLKHLTEWMRGHFKANNIQEMNEGYDGLLKWITHEETSSADY